jgi:hypothetical protein
MPLDRAVLKEYLHPDVILDWNSSKGFIQLDFDSLLNLSDELAKAYVRSKIRISHIIAENDMITVRYAHFVKHRESKRRDVVGKFYINLANKR